MQLYTIGFVLGHMNLHAQKLVPNVHKPFLLLLHGHKSRGAFQWLEKVKLANSEIIQPPTNTSHFLEPCDSTINKTFNRTIRSTSDILNSLSFIDTGDMSIRLMLGVSGYRSLTRVVLKQAFV